MPEERPRIRLNRPRNARDKTVSKISCDGVDTHWTKQLRQQYRLGRSTRLPYSPIIWTTLPARNNYYYLANSNSLSATGSSWEALLTICLSVCIRTRPCVLMCARAERNAVTQLARQRAST